MPDSDHQIMTCPDCLTEFQIEDNDQNGRDSSCPVCGTMADTEKKISPAEDDGDSMPLPAPKKSINLELPKMIIRNANPKRPRGKLQDPPPAKLKGIGSAASPQAATTRKFSGKSINWEADHEKENAPQSPSDAIDPNVNMRFKKAQRQHKYSAKAWVGFLLAAALLMIAALAILPRNGGKKSDAAPPQNRPGEPAITEVQKPVPEEAPPTSGPIQLAMKKHGVRGTHDKASEVVRKFLEATTLDERRVFTRSPHRVKPLMAGYYKTHDPGPIKYRSLTDQYESAPLNDYYLIGVTLDDLSIAYAIVAFEQDHFLVDWESFVGYSEMSLGKFMEERPGSATLFRLRVKPDDYYNFNFTAEQYQCLRLSNMDQTTVIYGYVMKGAGPISSLQPDQEEFFTLRLSYPEKSETANQVIVDEVITRGWVIE